NGDADDEELERHVRCGRCANRKRRRHDEWKLRQGPAPENQTDLRAGREPGEREASRPDGDDRRDRRDGSRKVEHQRPRRLSYAAHDLRGAAPGCNERKRREQEDGDGRYECALPKVVAQTIVGRRYGRYTAARKANSASVS